MNACFYFSEFSQTVREMGTCLLEKTAMNDDEESGRSMRFTFFQHVEFDFFFFFYIFKRSGIVALIIFHIDTEHFQT